MKWRPPIRSIGVRANQAVATAVIGVGDSRSGRHDRHSELAGQPGVGLGGVGGRLLVTDVDDLDSLLDATVEDGDDVAPREGEDGVDPLGLEGPGDDLAAVNLHGSRLDGGGEASTLTTRGTSRSSRLR